MKTLRTTLFVLRIPFTESFSHSIKERTYSDSIVVKLETADGTIGYGEAVARPYVTGETVESCLEFMANTIWPKIAQIDYPEAELDGIAWLNAISYTIPESQSENNPNSVIAWNAAKTGFELALIDCLLKSQNLSLATILPPKRTTIIYSGVLTSISIEKAVKNAKYFKLFGIRQIKIKITGLGDRDRIQAIRQAVGADVSLRIDANGIYDPELAVVALKELAQFNLDSVEQPIPRSTPEVLAKVRAKSPIPIMVDESLVTLEDAQALIAAAACDFFNLRISKCGGIAKTIAIAQLAQAADIKIQVGCQVGETAILSAAGRHLAAWLDEVAFAEGSYGNLLLAEDISQKSIRFGHGGRANLLSQPGLGITVQEHLLKKYAHQIMRLEPGD